MRRLAPLEPDAFLAWNQPRGTLTVEELWWEIYAPVVPEYSLTMLRHDFIGLAARVRRNQRLGLNPFDGMGVAT